MTNSERWRRLEDICHDALERRVEDRSNFIAEACEGDEELRLEIELLLVNVGVADSRLGIGHSQIAIDGVSGDLIGHQIGPYRILSLLGVGGMGEVYRAWDGRLNREVALKVLPAKFALNADRLARFRREAQILASLNHPHIAAIYGLEESDGDSALVLELVEGPTLADRLAGGAIPVDEVQPIVQQILEALEAAHEQGIIHRDLKPANIKVREDGTVKVLDFGLAKAFDSGPAAIAASQSPASPGPATMTGMGVLLGTPAYMSPEQARGKAVDKRTDLWAFGCVFYEMLTGRRAFAGHEGTDALASVLTREPDWTLLPAGLSPAIGPYLKRCLQKNRKQRIGDAQTMRLAVEGAFETTVAEIPTPSVTHL
jgi:serine/threonine protein kinase